jgi:hypothetical protein
MHAATPEDLIALLGGFPPKPPLALRVLERHEGVDHSRQLIEYSGASARISAYLPLPPSMPERHGTLPAVVAIHQDGDRTHRRFGKSEPAALLGDADQCYGIELCRRGYVVLCPDRPGFEDRQGQTTGSTGLGGELFELHRAVDCLLEQPEVDTARIGASALARSLVGRCWDAGTPFPRISYHPATTSPSRASRTCSTRTTCSPVSHHAPIWRCAGTRSVLPTTRS